MATFKENSKKEVEPSLSLDPTIDFWVVPWKRLPVPECFWAHAVIFVRSLLGPEQKAYLQSCLQSRITPLARGRYASCRVGTHAVQIVWTPTHDQEANRDMRYLVREVTEKVASYLRIRSPNVTYIRIDDLELERQLFSKNSWN